MGWGAVGWFVVELIVATAISYGISRLTQPEQPDVEGPRIDEMAMMDSAYGVPIPIIYGSMRVAGNIFWSTGLKEHKHEEDVGGGKGGGSGRTRTTYTYTCSFALGICEGKIVGINKIWMDGKLFQDANQENFASIVKSGEKAESISVYTGTETQESDPVMESHEGEGSVPAYRGLAYIVFENLRLADYGNRIPNIEIEIAVGLGEQNMTFEVPDNTKDVTFFDNGYYTVNKPDNENPLDSWTYVKDLQQGIIRSWQGNDSDYLISFKVSPQVSSRLSKEMALYIESFDDDFYVYDAATGEELISISGYWENSQIVDEGPNSADIGWLEEFGYYIWVAYINTVEILGVYNYDASTGGINVEVDAIDCPGSKDYGPTIKILNNKIYLGFGTVVYEYTSWYDIGVSGSVDSNNPGDYNKKVDFGGTSGGSFVAITPMGDFVSKNGTTCYIHSGMTAEIQQTYTFDTGSTGTQPLDAIAGDLLSRAGLDPLEYDVSDLTDQDVIGFSVTKSMSIKEAIKPLMQAYQFDVVEVEGQIKCVSRRQDLTRSFTEDELAAHEQGSDIPAAVEATRSQENSLPTKVTVKYKDQNAAYQTAAQYVKRVTQDFDNHKIVQLPIVTTADNALQIAEKLLATAWAERSNYSIQALSENIDLLPGSSINAAGYRMHIEEISTRLPSIIEIQGSSEEPSSYVSNAVATSPTVLDQSLPGAIPITFSIMMNLPGLNGVYDTPGFFVAPFVLGNASSWSGTVVYKTNDDGDTWFQVSTIITQTLVANVTSAPGTGPTTRWDHQNTLTIKPLSDRSDLLVSASKLSVLAGSNTAAIGSSFGEWEVISYMDVTDNGDGTYTLSGLLRGRRGTEDAVSATKSLFIFLKQDTLAFVPVDTADLGNSKDYKVVSIGKSVTSKSAEPHTSQGNTIKPWSPVHIEGTRSSSDDLTITWFRRSRVEESWNRGDIPMLESSESYEVDIMDGSGNVLRTLSISGEDSDQTGVTYTASQQTDDFGSVQSSVTVKVCQISDVVDRGFPGEATV